jgi:hypothetical protein
LGFDTVNLHRPTGAARARAAAAAAAVFLAPFVDAGGGRQRSSVVRWRWRRPRRWTRWGGAEREAGGGRKSREKAEEKQPVERSGDERTNERSAIRIRRAPSCETGHTPLASRRERERVEGSPCAGRMRRQTTCPFYGSLVPCAQFFWGDQTILLTAPQAKMPGGRDTRSRRALQRPDERLTRSRARYRDRQEDSPRTRTPPLTPRRLRFPSCRSSERAVGRKDISGRYGHAGPGGSAHLMRLSSSSPSLRLNASSFRNMASAHP